MTPTPRERAIMGLLDRITAEQDAAALATAGSILRSEQQQRNNRRRIGEIVNGRLQRLAEDMEVEVSLITAGDVYPRFGCFGGDIFFSVQPFHADGTLSLRPDHEEKVLEDFRLDVLGISLTTQRLQPVRVGTLRYVSYAGIVRTFASKPFEVSLEEVDEIRRAVVLAAESRLACGRTVLYGPANDAELKLLVVANTSAIKHCLLPAGHPGDCDPNPQR